MNKKMSKKIGVSEHVLVLLLGTLIVYGILAVTGTIHSGYHFLDDHELIRLQIGFEQHGAPLGLSIKNWILNDFWWRYRPLYWVERVTGAYFWGSELLYWNIYTAIKGVITFYCLYFMARYLKYGKVISAIVPCIVMLGSQFTPWYRSANQESTGLLLCAMALCLSAAQGYYKKYTDWRYNVPIVIFAVLAGLTKESFTLFMPAFIAFKFWLEYWDEDCAVTGKARLLKCLKSNIITYGIILLGMLINVCVIMFYVGVDNVSYAGFQEGVSLSAYVYGIKSSLTQYTRWYTLIGALIVLLVVVCYKNIEKKDITRYCGLALIGGYICGVQLVAHAKSGMWERYIIPYIIGYVFIFVLLAYRIFEKDRIHKLVFYGILFLLLYENVPVAYANAVSYTDNGRSVNSFLEGVKENTSETDEIICAFADEELNLATECWLEANERTQTYSLVNNEWKNEVQLLGTAPEEFSGLNANALVCYEWQIEDMLPLMGIADERQYVVYHFDGYSLVIRSKSNGDV